MNLKYVVALTLSLISVNSFAGGTVGSADSDTAIFNCQGFEPTWFAEINMKDQSLKLGDRTMKVHTTLEAKVTQAMSTSGNYAFSVRSPYSPASLAVVANTSCTDSFTDNTYTHSALMISEGGTPMHGCCKEK